MEHREEDSAYRESDLVCIAKRENNPKRKYLVVNRKQGKHIPVSPGEALAMFRALAAKLEEPYRGERLLLIGFAETATAIGACLALCLHCRLMQTTREEIPGVTYLHFSESHSHATQQKLVKEDLDIVMGQTDRVIFAEDEVTTGNTILSAIDAIGQVYGKCPAFSVASLLNGMDREAETEYKKRGIRLHYLVKTEHSGYEAVAEQYRGDGICRKNRGWDEPLPVRMLYPSGYLDARRLQEAEVYGRACQALCRQVLAGLNPDPSRRYLVLGTEEFMFPGLLLAWEMERQGCRVRFHATTRSPIAVSSEPEYPLHVRYELCSMYEKDRPVFVYDLAPCEEAVVVCDAQEMTEEGTEGLLSALSQSGSRQVTLVRWKG